MTDEFMLALCAWRENRHGQVAGMTSVMNVVMNRVYKNKTSPYSEVTRFEQFSSITAPGDIQLGLWPKVDDRSWQIAQTLASHAVQNVLADITGGATSYYALSMEKPPEWAAAMVETAIIAGQRFMKEKEEA